MLDTAKARAARGAPGYSREGAFDFIHQAVALAQMKEIPEATTRLAAAIPLINTHSSARLRHRFTEARRLLDPWSKNAYVRALDERLKPSATGAGQA
ncbi:hypothetical protein AB0K60_12510 [Thermopolyspora sp. NPDC052614]|uniref:hypothetical protein n=1 Tax=Thermopolyspora sp. NPDC052614 TaxID=3155682 RepID=UPI003431EB45